MTRIRDSAARSITKERHGRFLAIPALTDSDVIRLWKGIHRAGKDECWLWLKGTTSAGYGVMGIGSRTYLVTRILWLHWYGSDPRDLLVCHSCDNPPCCNPNHLFRGDYSSNMHDMHDKGRHWVGGNGAPNTALNEEMIPEIRAVIDATSVAQAARHYGISESTARNIKYRRTWGHVK